MRARTVALAVLLAALVVGAFLAYRSAEDRRFRADLAAARAELVAGRLFSALDQLQELGRRRPDSGEVQYLLGINALARGRVDQAEAAWSRIRPGDSPHFGYAALHQAEVDQDLGRLSVAEDRLRAGLADPGSHRPRVRWALAQLLVLEGRQREACRILADGIPEHPEPIFGLKDLYRLEHDPFPIEAARQLLEKSARLAPDDDRVSLGQAHLALRTGRLEEAKRLLDGCLKRHPDDQPAWELALDWGLEADRPDAVADALAHLPATPDLLPRAREVRAWAARRAGDRRAERAALEAWRAAEPTNPVPLERLAALAIVEGLPDEAAALRVLRAKQKHVREDYLNRLGLFEATTDPKGMDALAAEAGRPVDALYWARRLRHPPPPAPPAPPFRTLADALPDEVARLRTMPAAAARPTALTAPRFEDDARSAGLDFEHRTGASSGRPIPPVTMGGGVATLDYDGDGWLDVYVVQSGAFPPDPGAPALGDRLYRNNGNGTFQDVTAATGLAGLTGGYGHGVAVGDVDNDGRPDLFLTRWRSYALYRNKGDGTFEDVTVPWGLGGDRDWPTSAAFADLDRDGDLDLYVCHYLRWDENDPRSCLDPADPTKYACAPRNFPALPDHLFRNDGGRFTDVSQEAGIVDRDGRGLGVVAADLDDDGLVDLFVANDLSANYFWKNLGGLRFAERGLEAGVAGNESGRYQAGMGVACGDLDGDGRPDLAVTNFYGESTSFFRNLGGGQFADRTANVGLAAPSRYRLGFGAAFLDLDNDGRLDLLTANGHIHDGRPQFPFEMPAQLFRGNPNGGLTDISAEAGEPFQVGHVARGLAVGDLDNDGRADALMVAQNEMLIYLHNRTERVGRSLTFLLEGTRSNRDAVGASVTVVAEGRRRAAWRLGGGSYQSASDPRISIGLGDAAEAERVEVAWPSGRRDVLRSLAAGAYHFREGDPAPKPLKGWTRLAP